MGSTIRSDLFFAVAGLLIAVCVHSWNGVESGLPFGLHQTTDDPSYLRPAENFAGHGVWKDNTEGVSAYIQRPPGMGLVHLPFYLLLGKWAFVGEIIFFFLLHGLALYYLPGIFRHFLPRKPALLLSVLYASLPCFWGFLSYTITEAITPSLVILLLSAVLHRRKHSFSAAVFLLFVIWMTRPLLIFLFPAMLYLLWLRRDELKSGFKNALVVVACTLIAISWEARKMIITDREPYTLHPIYSATNATPFRPVHAAFSNLFRIWETQPGRFHAIMGSCWAGNICVRMQLVEDYYSNQDVPLDETSLKQLLEQYSKVNKEVLRSIADSTRTTAMTELPAEKQLRYKVDLLTQQLIAKNKVRYYLHTPLKSARELLVKSQLNLEVFQRYYRGRWWVEVLRFGCLILILIATAGTFMSLTSREKTLRWLAAGCMLYLFYLCYVQRMNEDRYLAPILPLLFITGGVYLCQLTLQLLQRIRRNKA